MGQIDIDEVRRSIWALARLNKIATIIASVGVPIVVGVWATFYDALDKISPAVFWLPLIFFIVLSLVYAYATYDIKLAPEVYIELEQEAEKNKLLSGSIQYLTVLHEQVLVWNLMTRDYLQNKINDQAELRVLCGKICEPIAEMRQVYFGFDGREFWNFALYLWDEEGKVLTPVWRQRATNHPSQGEGRNWKPGEGHVGHAFSSKEPIVTPDATQPELAAFMFNGGEQRDYDKVVYRSFVSQPITHSNIQANQPFGVLVATSNQAGRFDETNALVLKHAATVLATVLQVAYVKA